MYCCAPWSRVIGRSVVSAPEPMRSSHQPITSPGALPPVGAPRGSAASQPCAWARVAASQRAASRSPPSSVVRHSTWAWRSRSRASSSTASRGRTAAGRLPPASARASTAEPASWYAPMTTATAVTPSDLVDGPQDVGRVPVDLHVVPAARHLAVGPDEIGHAGHAHVGPAVEALLLPRAVLEGHLVVRIGEQGEIQLVLAREAGLARGVEHADPQHRG